MKKNKAIAIAASVLMLSSVGVACSNNNGGADNKPAASNAAAARDVDPRFGEAPFVVGDNDFSGIDASKLFYDHSETAVVTGMAKASQLRGASIAAVAHAPMLMNTPDNRAAILEELKRLKATKVLLVGDTDFAAAEATDDADITFIKDEGTIASLEAATSQSFTEKTTESTGQAITDIVNLDPKKPTLLVPEGYSTPAEGKAKEQENFPAQSALDDGNSPVVLTSPMSGIPATATAKAWGADLIALPWPDPRASEEGIKAVAGMEDKPVIALGRLFGSKENLKKRIVLSQEVTEEQPGGGQLVFPGRHVVALYGHHTGPALGAMGEQDSASAAERVVNIAEQYQQYVDDPVIPAFEMMATVASSDPGDDNDYSNEATTEELLDYLDAITEVGGYAVLDLQPGRARLLDQAKLYEELLRRPNVGLALDPEWKLGPNDLPLQNVGHVDAAEVNEVSDWLAKLVEENNLPQKPLVLHQFQLQMIRNREQLNVDYPELAIVLHADGHGTPDLKFQTWEVLKEGLDPRIFLAWKNFYDEDSPTFTPEQTMDIEPRPWFVSYQ
ncbi:cell wall-binding repeat-containing protein [Corynebacterium sp. TAE3-ERU30]|uniref:cell wall-binding repeat-containing protein n=1 Tax=Corynebacterium sp. TAE3-ERU30 TaxID=2849496 RepID=UPI001C45E55C|nr:MBL fold metallo-hydrolase [Corynebacterium sp. TAE3-ERU30]